MCSWERRDEEEDGGREGKISGKKREHDGAKLDGETKRRAERRLAMAIERQRKSGELTKRR